MIRMSFFRKLSTTQGVTTVLLRVVILNLDTSVLAAIVNIFYTFGNANMLIEKLLGDVGRNHQILDVLKPSESTRAESGGTWVFLVEVSNHI